jgi:hypothetical protein
MCDNNISNESYCSGGGGTDLTWIDPYLIEQPPAIVYGPNNPLTVGDTIYIPWYYPSQINVGFMGNNLPLILSFSSNLVTDSGTFPIVSSQSTGFINNYYTGVTGAVTGIAITSNTFITNGIYSYNGNNYYCKDPTQCLLLFHHSLHHIYTVHIIVGLVVLFDSVRSLNFEENFHFHMIPKHSHLYSNYSLLYFPEWVILDFRLHCSSDLHFY